MHTAPCALLARCSESCTVTSRAARRRRRGASAPRPRVLQRGLFRGERKVRALKVARAGRRLKLSQAGPPELRRTLDTQGRVAVVISA